VSTEASRSGEAPAGAAVAFGKGIKLSKGEEKGRSEIA
jgi:hypothetical protein